MKYLMDDIKDLGEQPDPSIDNSLFYRFEDSQDLLEQIRSKSSYYGDRSSIKGNIITNCYEEMFRALSELKH